MCGIAGYYGEGTKEELDVMIGAIKHRGPDDGGIFMERGVGLAHARLSIIDVSPLGRQPMSLQDGSVTITFNGEIYNYQELRERLVREGCAFRGTSDTEVILWLYKKKGVACFRELTGMFALALYDKEADRLILARDRMGEKPLYWTKQGGTILFASELRALMSNARVPKTLEQESVAAYLALDYVPTPYTILKNVFKLEPATLLICTRDGVRKEEYWKPESSPFVGTLRDATGRLGELLQKSVSRELAASDVPTGVFLSGGLDSSTVAYLAQHSSRTRVKTFSIGFSDPSFDESHYAREVARHLGTDHFEEVLSPTAALELVRDMPEVLSEPVADASVLPAMLLSRFARQGVTVALGGDGGDELFAGYPTFQADPFSAMYRRLPGKLRAALLLMSEQLPASKANFSLSYQLRKFLSSDAGDDIERHLQWLGSFYGSPLQKIAGKGLGDARGYDAYAYARSCVEGTDIKDRRNQLLYLYARTYLMDQVLVKVDRASMRYGLETRAPFLDHSVVDFVLSLPYDFKLRRGVTKFILKKFAEHKLPWHIVHRKKKGFGVPMARWLGNELRPLCEELLSPAALAKHDLFNAQYVEQLKKEHLDGKKDNRKELWNLMVFQLWYQRWIG